MYQDQVWQLLRDQIPRRYSMAWYVTQNESLALKYCVQAMCASVLKNQSLIEDFSRPGLGDLNFLKQKLLETYATQLMKLTSQREAKMQKALTNVQERLILFLRHDYGMGLSEIANILNLEIFRVVEKIHQARAQFQAESFDYKCPKTFELLPYVDGLMKGSELRIRTHLSQCQYCQGRLDHINSHFDLIEGHLNQYNLKIESSILFTLESEVNAFIKQLFPAKQSWQIKLELLQNKLLSLKHLFSNKFEWK